MEHQINLEDDTNEELVYQSWLDNELNEFFYNTPIYSRNDIILATQYASDSITIAPNEVGKKLYDELYEEKVLEYLTNLKL
jgi:predicted nuclease of restriction endonuclease-like RecB superfamily